MPRLQPTPAPNADAEAGAARLRTAKEKKETARKKKEERKNAVSVRSVRHTVDTRDRKIGQEGVREMPSTGRARIEPGEIEQVDRPVSKAKLEQLAFNEEILTVIVHESADPQDEPVPYVLNGGRRQAFFRGKEQQVRRKYVEVLARLKKVTYTQEKYKDSQGIDAIRNIPHNTLRYPFAVIHDPNPRGGDWLKAILAEGQ